MLSDLLESELFAFLLVLVRMIPVFLLMPIFSEKSIPRNVRASFALALSILMSQTAPGIPDMPAQPFMLAGLALREVLVGTLLALTMRMIMTATHLAGTVIAFQTGLAAAQSFDPSQGGQSAILSTFMTVVTVTLFVVMDIHHLMLMAIGNSYTMFPVNEAIPIEDFSRVIIYYVSASFLIGIQMSAPFLVYGVVYNVGLGLIARLAPRIQVFFVGMPLNILLGFILFMILFPSMMLLFIDQYRDLLGRFLG